MTHELKKWTRTEEATPPENVELDAKIQVGFGSWNLVTMTYRDGGWFAEGHRMTGHLPTHWRLKEPNK